MKNNEVNLISNNASEIDKDLFFGPIKSEEEFIIFDSSINDLAKLMAIAGLFSSASQARKNGFGKPVEGFYSMTFGKQKTKIWILNLKNP